LGIVRQNATFPTNKPPYRYTSTPLDYAKKEGTMSSVHDILLRQFLPPKDALDVQSGGLRRYTLIRTPKPQDQEGLSFYHLIPESIDNVTNNLLCSYGFRGTYPGGRVGITSLWRAALMAATLIEKRRRRRKKRKNWISEVQQEVLHQCAKQRLVALRHRRNRAFRKNKCDEPPIPEE